MKYFINPYLLYLCSVSALVLYILGFGPYELCKVHGCKEEKTVLLVISVITFVYAFVISKFDPGFVEINKKKYKQIMFLYVLFTIIAITSAYFIMH